VTMDEIKNHKQDRLCVRYQETAVSCKKKPCFQVPGYRYRLLPDSWVPVPSASSFLGYRDRLLPDSWVPVPAASRFLSTGTGCFPDSWVPVLVVSRFLGTSTGCFQIPGYRYRLLPDSWVPVPVPVPVLLNKFFTIGRSIKIKLLSFFV
jgi:hypothetical protein